MTLILEAIRMRMALPHTLLVQGEQRFSSAMHQDLGLAQAQP